METSGPLSFGQLSVMRAVQDLPVTQWHESNLRTLWTLPEPVPPAKAVAARHALRTRHVSLRTVYDLDDPAVPRQVVRSAAARKRWESSLAAKTSSTDAVRVFSQCRPAARSRARKPSARCSWAISVSRWGGCPAGVRPGSRRAASMFCHRICLADPSATMWWLTSATRSARASRRGGVSVFALLLAAHATAVAEVQGVRSIPMRMESSNRHGNSWTGHVTSMNQWAPTHVGVSAGGAVTALAQRLALGLGLGLGLKSLPAFRNGVFDLDAVTRRCARHPAAVASHDEVWSFNFIVRGVSGDPGSFEPFEATEEDDRRPAYEPAFLTLGPRFHPRVMDDGADAWALRLRANGVPRETAGAVLRTMHETLLAQGRAGVPRKARVRARTLGAPSAWGVPLNPPVP